MAAGTVTYRCPASVAGGTTAPTAGQVTNCVIADVTMADTSTITTVSCPGLQATTTGVKGDPMISIFTLVAGATPVGTGITVGFTTNGITLSNFTSAAGNGQTYRIQIWRHSLITNFTL